MASYEHDGRTQNFESAFAEVITLSEHRSELDIWIASTLSEC